MKLHILKYSLLFLWVLSFVQTEAQETSRYSKLKQVVEIDYNMLLDSAHFYSDSDVGKAYDFAERALMASLQNNNQEAEAECYHVIAIINYNYNQYDIALENILKVLQIFTETDFTNKKTKDRFELRAQIYKQLNEFELALDDYNMLYDNAVKTQNEEESNRYQLEIAAVYTQQKEYSSAYEIYEQELSKEKAKGNKKKMIKIQDEIANLYMEQEEDDKALELYQSSEVIADEINDPVAKQSSMQNISSIFKKKGDVANEFDNRQRALEYSEIIDDKEAQSQETYEIGNLLIEQQKSEEAIPVLQKSIDITEVTGDIEQKTKALKSLSTAYDIQGDISKALATYKEYIAYNDDLVREKEAELLSKIDMANTLNRKQQRVEMLEKNKQLNDQTIDLLRNQKELKEREIKSKELIIYSLIFGLVIILISSYFVYRSGRQKRIANQLLALKSLRTQMNPHFIFNALNSVNNYIAQSDERSANKYLSEFARLMRLVLDNSKQDFIPLQTEIETLQRYLGLEHLRFTEKFDYEFIIDRDLDVEAFYIPPMLVQPYIENAVWHGLRYKEDKGTLKVKMHQFEERLIITITDDGIGRKKSVEIKTKAQKETESTGLKNISQRLQIINEVHYTEIKIAINDLNSDDNTGTMVSIEVPKFNMNE